MLARLKPDRILSSDMSRATDTAQALADLVGVPVESTEALREINGGIWEGKRATELASDPEYVAWSSGVDVRAGGAERRSDVAVRAANQDLLAKLASQLAAGWEEARPK